MNACLKEEQQRAEKGVDMEDRLLNKVRKESSYWCTIRC